MKLKRIDIESIEGFKFGNAENIEAGTGCTVVVCEDGAVGGVDVRGGAPATRETDLLKSENTVDRVHAVMLSGGSAFGLEAGSGAMRELAHRGIGVKVHDVNVPIVCGASLFDLEVGKSDVFPDIEMGREAVCNAYDGEFMNGNHGAGTGATVGKILGMDRAMKAGLGTFACSDEIVEVGAVVAVNACADIYNGAGNIISGLRTEDGSSIYGSIKVLKGMVRPETEEESLFGEFSKSNAKVQQHSEHKTVHTASEEKVDIAKAIMEAYEAEAKTTEETITENIIVEETPTALMETQEAGREADINIETESVLEDDMTSVNFRTAKDEVGSENLYDNNDEDLGYAIPFNTTIACLVTNAIMTKSQANKLASILHDAYARAIKPVHSTMDGDTIFVLSRCTQEVNFDAFAALATDVMQYAIIDGANAAEGAYGLPASRDMITK